MNLREFAMREFAWWLIVVASAPILFINFIWVFHGTFAPMGWGGRSTPSILVTMLFGVWVPVAASTYFAVRAISISRQSLGRSALMLLYSVLCILAGYAVTGITGSWVE